jgi:hypothetical protein
MIDDHLTESYVDFQESIAARLFFLAATCPGIS